jgi:protein-S-isoprenylcysteine O-methyltransferase Ste14
LGGPYRYVRNPMYLGAGVALSGAALTYVSLPLFLYALGFVAAMHMFVVNYEEPALAGTFGLEYETYRSRVPRWVPRLGGESPR